MAKVDIQLNHVGMHELLNSHEVAAYLRRRMEPVLAAAQQGAPQHNIDIQEVTHRSRVVMRVINESPDAVTYEADHGTLVRAFHLAGGSA